MPEVYIENNEFFLVQMTQIFNSSGYKPEDLISLMRESAEKRFTRVNYTWYTEVILVASYIIIAILGFIFNIFISCTIVFSSKLLKNPSNILVINLMASDLLMAIFCMPFTLISTIRRSYIYGSTMCKMIPFLQSTSILVCSFTIATIAIDRLIRITLNYQRSTYQVLFQKTHRWLIAIETLVIWILSLLFSMPVAYYQTLFRVSFEGSVNFIKCIENWPNETAKGYYALFIMVTQFFMPTIVLIVTHMIIGHRLNSNLSGLTEAASVNTSSCTVVPSNTPKAGVSRVGAQLHTGADKSSMSVSLVEKSTSISNINPCYSRYFNGREDNGTSRSSQKNSFSTRQLERCSSKCIHASHHNGNISDDATLTSGHLRCASAGNAVEDTSPLMASEVVNSLSTMASEEEGGQVGVQVEEEEEEGEEEEEENNQEVFEAESLNACSKKSKLVKSSESTSSVDAKTIDTRQQVVACASDRLHETQSTDSTGRECEISIEQADNKSSAPETDAVVVVSVATSEIDYTVSDVSASVMEDAVIRSTSMPYIRKVECINCNDTCKRRGSSFFASRLLRVSRISPSSSVNTEPAGVVHAETMTSSSSTSGASVFQARNSKWKSEMDQVKQLDSSCVTRNSCRLSKLTGIDLSKIDDHHHHHHHHEDASLHHSHVHEYQCPSHVDASSMGSSDHPHQHEQSDQVIREMPEVVERTPQHQLPRHSSVMNSSSSTSTSRSNACDQFGESSNLSTSRERRRRSVGCSSTSYTSTTLHQGKQEAQEEVEKVNEKMMGSKFVEVSSVSRKRKFRSARFAGRGKTVKLSISRVCNLNTDSLSNCNTVGGTSASVGESYFSRDRIISSPAFLSRDSPSCTTRISDERGILMREIRRNRQVTCVLLSISACFTLTWLPWNVFNVYLDFNVDTSLTIDQIYLIQAICHLIAMITIPSNAFWYGWSNPLIRSEGLRFLSSASHLIQVKCMRFCSNFSSSSSSSSSASSSSSRSNVRAAGAVGANNVRISNSLTC